MHVEFIGAAQTVTGSKHLVRTKKATILLDCGLFQGRRRESIEKNRALGVDPGEIDAVVLSHAHIDHSGALPLLVKRGYRGPIYATPATYDLCAAMLADAALIQEADARYINKVIARDLADMDPVVPLYESEDVVRVLDQMISLPYGRSQIIARGVSVTLLDAGHVLGSAVIALDCDDGGSTKRVVFSGDLGRPGMPILRSPEAPHGADLLLLESTYGDREHPGIVEMDDALARVVMRTFERRGKLIIPSFALERAQEIVYALRRLERAGRLPDIPVYIDSPLTVKITEVFKMHPECYGEAARAMLRSGDSPFELRRLRYVSDAEESKAITAAEGPQIVIAASGMCEGGRVLHHLKATVESERNTILIVGFQAQHTLGRRIAERRSRVRIFGVERDLRAEVAVLDGFSAHAGQRDLVAFAERVRAGGRLGTTALVHGEPGAQAALRDVLNERGLGPVITPAPGDRISV